ncbi:MAG: aminoacyl-tRNA hydrolase [Clostridia bacterium]
MKIVVGLGNPGEKYEKTRHNTGWLFLEYMEGKYGFVIDRKKHDSLICEIDINGEKVVFAKPLTYMNLSGNAVQKLKKWYKVENKDILIVFDDVDIEFGKVRIRENGSGGTHNGMKNIIQMLSTTEIPRLRIGLGGLKHENQEILDFVLDRFSKPELNELEHIFADCEQKLLEFLDK